MNLSAYREAVEYANSVRDNDPEIHEAAIKLARTTAMSFREAVEHLRLLKIIEAAWSDE